MAESGRRKTEAERTAGEHARMAELSDLLFPGTGFGGITVLRRLFIPLAALVVILVAGFGWMLYSSWVVTWESADRRILGRVQAEWDRVMTEQTRELSACLAPVAEAPDTATDLREGNREALEVRARGVFEEARRDHGVTHFLFHGADRQTLAALHRPVRPGEFSDRFTLREAERTGAETAGLEVGKRGTFTLRVVRPVRDAGGIAGFVEMGMEIEHLLNRILLPSDNSLAVTLWKRQLERGLWEEGMRWMGREPDWGRFPEEVLVWANPAADPACLKRFLQGTKRQRRHPGGEDVVAAAARTWRPILKPLNDAGGTEVGRLVVLYDIRWLKVAQQRLLTLLAGGGVFLAAGFLVLIHALLRRADRVVHSRETELRVFKEAVDNAADAIVMATPDLKRVYQNRAFDRLAGRDWSDPQQVYLDAEKWKEVYEALCAGGEWSGETNIRTIGGEMRRMLISAYALRNPDGQVAVLVGLHTDVTEHRRAEEILRQGAALRSGLFEHMTSGAAIYEVRGDGSRGEDYIVKEFNAASLKMEGLPHEDVVGKSLADLRPTINRFGLIEVFQRVWQTGEAAVMPPALYVDGQYCNWYENRVFKLPTGEIVSIYDDVTERKLAEKHQQELTDRLGKLTRHLQGVREEESRRIAVWLHDVVGQMLTRARMDAMLLEDPAGVATGAEAREALGSLKRTLDDAVKTIRSISMDLRPAILDDFGLVAALEWSIHEDQKRLRIPIRFETDGVPEPLTGEVAVAFYRMARECLTNIARHAKAASANVRLAADGTTLTLVVSDDGRGMTPEAIDSPMSFGLSQLFERANALGGDVQIVSQPGYGTTVRITAPLPPAEPPGEPS